MKAKIFSLMALVLGMVSCQTEPEGLDVIVDGVVDTVVTVNIPESETRANAGTNSAEGAFTNGVLGTESDNTTMRYIFQVYYNGETSDDMHHRQVAYSDGASVSFPVRLIPGRDYRFVVWADVVADGKNDTDLHYNTDNLTNITLKGDWNAMDETRDAFTAYKDVVQYNGQQAINIDLYRPFAKLRVLTTDFDVLESYGVSAKYATVEYTTEHRVGFNAYTGAAAAASETKKTHRYEIANYSTETNASRTIFSDYFFAENDVVSFNLNVYEDEDRTKLIKQIAFNTDINVKRNYLTTLKGNVLTEGNKVNIEVKPGLGGADDPDYNYNVLTSGDELVAAIANGGSYKVGNNIYVADTRAALATRNAAGQTTTILNLNGHKIIFEEGATIKVPEGKTLIINDETENNTGAIEAGNNAGFDNEGTIKIESGIVGESSIDNNGGTVNIEGGDLAEGAVQNNSGTANIVGDNIDKTVVYGEVTDYYAGIIKAFAEGGEFTLGASLKLEQPLTLANGKTLKLTIAEGVVLSIVDTTSKNFQLIDNRGTLTVEGAGKMTVEATINSGWNRYSAVIANNPGGNLTVKGVTLEHLGGTDMAYGIDNLTNGKGTYAETTVNNGAVVKSPYRAIRQFLNGIEAQNILTVNAGAVVEGANKSIWMQDPSANANTGKLVVNEGATLNGDVYLFVCAGSTEWPVEVSIAASAVNGEVLTGNVPAGYEVVEENGVWVVKAYEVVANGLYKKDAKTYLVMNAEGLVALSKINIKGNEVVELGADINLTGVEFNGLKAFNSETPNTFDGKGYTVSNWTNESGASDLGFICSWVGTIKNVKFDNCHLKTSGRSAIVAANTYSNIENVEVTNSSIEDSYWACGLVAGLYNSGSISNCTVTNSSVKSNGGTAAIVGAINESAGVRALTNCSVSGCTIHNTGAYGAGYSAGALVGIFNVSGATYKFVNCSVADNTLEGKYVYEMYPADESANIVIE